VATAPVGAQGRPISLATPNLANWQVVIVNYRTAALAARAARSVHRAAPGADLVVVDNASGDGCEELIAKDGLARYLSVPENRGYGAALNIGARNSQADYLLLLNADVQIGADAILGFQSRFEAVPRLGLVAPRLLSPDRTVQPSCRLFPTYRSLLWSRGSPLGKLRSKSDRVYRLPEPNSFTLTDVVAGACLAVRTAVWRELGGMDEGFFLYAEDTDFCLRAKQAGWLIGYDPAVAVVHDWGASTLLARRRSHRLHAESLSRYFQKHYPDRIWANAAVSCVLRIHARLRG
jgi:N-acetylglucosaminyl-diphospho-decaprenol L-rhamnosyltransferase